MRDIHRFECIDTAFFIIPNTTYPIRMIQLVGFISAISFNPVDRDRSTAAGVDLRMTITCEYEVVDEFAVHRGWSLIFFLPCTGFSG